MVQRGCDAVTLSLLGAQVEEAGVDAETIVMTLRTSR